MPIDIPLVLVSGLPRSGTSLMMRMLATGGLPLCCDESRPADEDNPQGYFEWLPILNLCRDPSVLDLPNLSGHALKCISSLLPYMPLCHRYKVIFMSRPIPEVLASQQKMLLRRGHSSHESNDLNLAAALEKHQQDSLMFLTSHTCNFETLIVDYPSLVINPDLCIGRIVALIGKELLPNYKNMAAEVRSELYRNRT